MLPGKPSLTTPDPEDSQCKAPDLCETTPDIGKREPPRSLSVSNWAHSSGVSYVFHRKCKHKQSTVRGHGEGGERGVSSFSA